MTSATVQISPHRLQRLNVFFAERYPLLKQVFVALLLFSEIYFVLLLNDGVRSFHLGAQEAVAIWTIFAFLMMLRVADDFKDYETDQRLFPDRPVASGRTRLSDLWWVVAVVVPVTVGLNVWLMNNLDFFAVLSAYGLLMSFWFFQKARIQPNLVAAVVTHNPVAMIMNFYLLSFTIRKYGLEWNQWVVYLLAFTMYFPSLIWEVARKIRAPKDETDYVTYSSLFGYRKATRFVLVLTIIDICTNFALGWNLSRLGVALLALNVAWMIWICVDFIKDPNRYKLLEKVERYTFITEALMIGSVVLNLTAGRI